MTINLQRIRGKRIDNQLNETTMSDLESKTKNFEPGSKKRQHAVNDVQVRQMKLIPYSQTGQLEVSATVTSGPKTYQTTIVFDDVTYHETDEANNVSFVGSDGDEHHITPMILAKHNVKVNCECLDFYWRFASHNAKDDSLHGRAPEPYQKKTDRPPVNPRSVPGVCKHIMKVVIALKQSGVVSK